MSQPFLPETPLENDLQKLLVALRRDCDLDMGHEVSRFLASVEGRTPFADTREFLERLSQAHSNACRLIDAYVVEHTYAEKEVSNG